MPLKITPILPKKVDNCLTSVQEQVLMFIITYTQLCDRPPTYREIKKAMGYSAVGSVQSMVSVLRRNGYLVPKKDKVESRCLKLTERAQQEYAEQIMKPHHRELG